MSMSYASRSENMPIQAYTLLAQYNLEQNRVIHGEFRKTY